MLIVTYFRWEQAVLVIKIEKQQAGEDEEGVYLCDPIV